MNVLGKALYGCAEGDAAFGQFLRLGFCNSPSINGSEVVGKILGGECDGAFSGMGVHKK
jgi:hypothetical protein